MMLIVGQLKTVGVLDGVKKDMVKLLKKEMVQVFAESNNILPMLLIDFTNKILNNLFMHFFIF